MADDALPALPQEPRMVPARRAVQLVRASFPSSFLSRAHVRVNFLSRSDSIHDLALAEFAKDDVRFASRRGAGWKGERERGKAGSKHSHCWAYVQGLCHVTECQYLHPAAVHLCTSQPMNTPKTADRSP